MNRPPVHPPEKVLVRGVNWVGDAVMTTPALMRLRSALPRAELTLLTQEKLAGLWHHHPSVDRVLTISENESVLRVARRLRSEHFQVALVLPNSFRSALEVWWGRIPRRIGYPAPWRNWLLNERVARHAEMRTMPKRSAAEIRRVIGAGGGRPPVSMAGAHHLYHYLHLAAALGANPEPLAPCLSVSAAEVEAVRQRFGLTADPPKPWLALNPGAEYGPAKRWPAERFAAAALAVRRATDCRWIIVGGRGDVELATDTAARVRQGLMTELSLEPESARLEVVNLAGSTSLRELCAVLKICRVLLTNDTGPMHIAAAVGTSVVVPFGSTSPELTGPGLPGDARHRLLTASAPCAPCFRRTCPIDLRCLGGINVEAVASAVQQALQD